METGGGERRAGERGPLLLPLAFTGALVLLALTPRVQANPSLTASFWGAAAVLALWQAALLAGLAGRTGPRTLVVNLRPQHWVQALVQLSVFVYWGWFWRPVYDMAVLILAQIVFAYAFDMLLAWSRRERYTLGFGPFPIIFSINLFLWFRDDWFALQFLMIALGFMGKEYIRWRREGISRHIFNPSAFSLGFFSLALIVTGTTGLTWGYEIASTLTLAPGIYTFLFLAGLVVMYFFAITPVAGTAAAVLFGASALYGSVTGVPYFLDSEIPAAVFLGLHLLVTDPSTSPRTTLGKAIFGGLYGLGVFGLYWLLGAAGAPTFYDKLLCVPLLNLCVPWIDALVRTWRERRPLEGWRERLRAAVGPRPNLAHMGVWIVFFVAMTALGRTDGLHPGDRVPFWEEACAEGRRKACARLIEVETTYCNDRSAWACNELGRHLREGVLTDADPRAANAYFGRACELRFQAACLNLLDTSRVARTDPKELDLRLLLRQGGLNLMDAPGSELYGRACTHGWTFACERMGAGA